MTRFFIKLMIVVVLLNGAVSGQTLPRTSKVPDRYFIDRVPFTRQLPNHCGPASLSSLLSYWSIKQDQKTIAEAAFDDRTSSTNGSDLLFHCRDIGLSAYSFNGNLSQLKKIISGGCPVIVLQEMSRTWHEGHFRIAVGYNDLKSTITLRDGVKSDYVILPYSEFDLLWGKRGRWALVALPREKDVFAETLGRRNSVLHMDLAQAYLRRDDFRTAEDECMRALRIEPGNIYAKQLLRKAKAHEK